MVSSSVMALALLLGGQASPPQTTQLQPDPQPTEAQADLGEVTVLGRSLDSRVESFIEEVAAPPKGVGLARWHRDVCIGVANLAQPYAQFVVDRVSEVALDLGLNTGEPGCKANVMIIFANDASDVARRIVSEDPDGFRPALQHTDLGRDALDRFQNSDAPVRWWHVSLPVSADTGDLAIALSSDDEPPSLTVRGSSRLRSGIRNDLARVIIIVDMTQLGETRFSALADYLALLSMAQINPDAEVSSEASILSLFNSGTLQDAMTDWDMNYLRSLYEAPGDRPNPAYQAREIGRVMVRSKQAASDAGGD
ncbi:hypothetical protein [Brevundimonas sp. SL130]|uniref:hypothetical protein n=1 Tax=Brevundimonas sp. SL130 TaxID=2995143 RepID=UPI00226D3BE1|nr:hypothetical protein [Brevundimonas sp. SL130]WAC61484.1 hypothetical protein OU998_08620 [Brevundimonas sp. SL130]